MPSLLTRLDSVGAFIFDLDGTLYQQGRPIPGAVEALARLRRLGLPLRFLTNTTSKCLSAIAGDMRRMGFAVEPDEIFNPPAAAGRLLRGRGESAALLVPEGALPDLKGVRRQEANPDWVVVGDLGPAWTFDKLNRAFRLIHAGAGLMGLGRTRYWQAPDGLRLDVGPFLAALEYAGATKARIVGKPEKEFFDLAVRDLGIEPSRIAMAGDDIRGDVEGAMRAGILGILVRTGKFRPQDLEGGISPNLVLDSVSDIFA